MGSWTDRFFPSPCLSPSVCVCALSIRLELSTNYNREENNWSIVMARAADKQQVIKNAQRLRLAEGFIAAGSLLFLIFRLVLDYQNTSGILRAVVVATLPESSCYRDLELSMRGWRKREGISTASMLRARQDMDVLYSRIREREPRVPLAARAGKDQVQPWRIAGGPWL